ncbi:MAG: type II toxin-antitoxin system ParD family antitoxin [Rhizobiaceae bacterium]
MSDIQKISVALTKQQIQAIKDAVASGEYASTSEVVRDALRGWQIREPLRKAEIERLSKAWAEGLASGPARELDFEEIKRRGRERLAAMSRD